MPTVRFDLETGHQLREVLGGVEIIRVLMVEGLTAAPQGQLLEALRDPAVPNLGNVYPGETFYFVTEREAFPAGRNKARVVLTYSNRQGTTWNQPIPIGDGQDIKQFTASTVRRKEIFDNSATKMTIPATVLTEGFPDYVSEADVERPAGALQFERSESAPPTQRVRDMVGTVNATSLGGGSWGAKTLLFARCDGYSDDGGRVWRVTYEFRYDPQGWVHKDRFHGPDGKVPTDAVDHTFDIYNDINWNLGLDFSLGQNPI